jgi:hypothetical protein
MRMVEVFLPIGESLKTVHHGAIEPVCGVGQNEDSPIGRNTSTIRMVPFSVSLMRP